MSDKQQTITAEKLCSLTGLTDRRHRQIAKEGFFPAPSRGNYQLSPTIQGMFRYYRELQTKRSGAFIEERERRERAKRRKDEVSADLAEKKVIPIDEAKRAFIYAAATTKTRILTVPSIAPSLVGLDAAQIDKRIKETIIDALRELENHEWTRSQPEE